MCDDGRGQGSDKDLTISLLLGAVVSFAAGYTGLELHTFRHPDNQVPLYFPIV